GVEHGRRSNGDCRLADATPEAAARHHDYFHVRHLAYPHRIIAVEVGLLDATILDRAPAVEQPGETKNKGAGDLPLDLRRIDDRAGIGGNDAVHLDLVAVSDGNFGG